MRISPRHLCIGLLYSVILHTQATVPATDGVATPVADRAAPAVDVATPAVDVATPAVDVTTSAVDVTTPARDAAVAHGAASPQQQTGSGAAVTTSGTPVSFTPVDGARFERVLVSQSSASMGGEAVSVRVIRSQVGERWEKSGDQWLLHCTPVEASVQDGVISIARLEEVLLNQSYTIVFNAKGEVLEVRGFDDISQKLKSAFKQDNLQQIIGDLTPELMRAGVARSQNYQFNWLFGKRWNVGEHHTEQIVLPAVNGERISIDKTFTVSAIDPKVLILSLQADGRSSAEVFSEKGTVTLDVASGQLQQLQRTRLIEQNLPDVDGNTIAMKESEVLTINWRRVN